MRDELGFTKVAGAVLATLLVIFGLQNLSDIIYAPQPAPKAGYAVQVAEESAGPAEQADNPPDWGTVLPTANIQAGAEQSQKCMSCHSFAKGGANMTGPDNWGVIGRKPGTHPGFDYSPAMVAFGQKVPAWDYDHLYMFLKNPQDYIQGTKMTFAGLKSPEDRINLIAWLRQQSDSPAPIPPPNPKKAAAQPGPGKAPIPVTGKAASGGSSASAAKQAPSSGAAAAPSAVTNTPGQTTSSAKG